MRRPTERFAASARRRACLRWSATWIASPKLSVFRPIEIRRRNFLKPGQTTTTDQIVREPIDMDKLLDRALELSDYRAKKDHFAKENLAGTSKKGMGIAAFLHGAGFTGSGERYLSSVVGVEGCADGRVRVLVSSTEFGQGTKTVLCQIAAEALGLPYEDVKSRRLTRTRFRIAAPRSLRAPSWWWANWCSRLRWESDRHWRAAACWASLIPQKNSAPRAGSRLRPMGHSAHGHATRRPSDVFWDDEKYRGEAYAAFAWAVYVAEVTVDLTTYSASVDDFVALQEVGRVLHPVLARGQIAGGVAQGIGYTLYEKVLWQNGRMQNGQMTNYIMPTSADLPPIRVFFEELGNVHGAFGAKGIGELPMDGPGSGDYQRGGRRAQGSVRFDPAASGGYF